MDDNNRPIIVIKKIKKGGHGHHGGAWKIAYADFVTAMMAFFLLMWLLSISSEETKKGIASYFTSNVIQMDAVRGTDGILAGSNNPSPNNTDAQDFDQTDKEEIARTDSTDAQQLGVQPSMNKSEDNQLSTGPQGKGYDNLGSSRKQSQPLNVGRGESDGQNAANISENKKSEQDEAKSEKTADPDEGTQNANISRVTQEFLVPSQPDGKLTPDTKDESGRDVREYKKTLEETAREKRQDGDTNKPKKVDLKNVPSIGQQKKKFKELGKELKKELEKNKELKKFSSNVRITYTNKGMQIQVLDDEKTAMFLSGGSEPMGATKKILGLIADVIKQVNNGIEITGHTDSAPYANTSRYTNWELSSDRAHAVRRFLSRRGIDPTRYKEVAGKAATQPLIKENPKHPSNRRVSMLLLYKK